MALSKENLYKQIVQKMTANGEKLGLSERSINEQLDTLIPLFGSDENITEEDFITKTLSLFQTANNNIKNDVSVGIKNFKKEFEDKNDKNKPNAGGNGNEDQLEKLLERIKVLEDNNNKFQLEKTLKEKKSSIKTYLKEKGVDNENWINLIIDQVSIGDNDDVEEKGKQLLDMYNSMKADPNLNITPNGGSQTDKGNSLFEEILKEAGEQVKNSL